jgi:hypothetical protein
MTPQQPLNIVLDYIDSQFDKLDRAAHELRRDAIHMACSVAAGGDATRSAKLICACIEAGLYTSPHETLADDLKRVIGGVQ